jgi:hypothetical protein
MPKVSPIYTNFNSGEMSPLAAGRSDLDQYNKAGLDYKNTYVTQYGPFFSKPGSFYVANTKNNDKASRLLRFSFSPSDSQIIEMGDLYFRFFNSDGVIGGPFEEPSTYTEAEIFDTQYAQSNDVITLTHAAHKPAKLTRLTPTTWSLDDYVFFGNPYLPDNTVEADLITPSASAAGATGTLTATGGHSPFSSLHVGTFWKIGEPTGSPEEQGYVEITGFTSGTVVDMKVIKELDGTTATSIWAEAAWSDLRGWPARCWYVGGRLFFARTDTQPNGIWGSKPFIFDNFDPGTGLADEGISELLPASSEIQWLTGLRTLLIGTNVGDFVASGDPTTGLSPEGFDIIQQTGWGAEPIQPQLIGSQAYAVQTKGRKLRELFYRFQEDSYLSVDTTAIAEHITKGRIVDMAYQRDPYSINYCVLGSGKMALMTREVDQQVLGWTPWDIEDGEAFFESVATIPHPTEDHDMVWAIVNVEVDGSEERHVVYFENPIIPDRQDLCFYLDDGVRYDAFAENTGDTLTLSALTGTGITVTAGASVFVSGDVGKRIRAIDIETGEILGELTITQFNSGTEVLGDVADNADFDSLTYAANEWGISVVTVSGLDHLEGKTVKLLIDGGTSDDEVVSSGAITVPDEENGFVFAVGLGYVSRWKNMPIEAGSATGTAQGKKKRIYQCGYKFFRSMGMKSGGDDDNLRDIILRDPDTNLGEPEGLFTGIVPPQKIDSTWNYEGHIIIQQEVPLPMCVTSVMPLMETNDK